jgi:nicotinate-nucleotide adenylyltransferase
LDAVWFLPTAQPPHKPDCHPTPVETRIEMLELATAGNPAFAVCRYEADRGGMNYTADTLAHLHEEDPTRELFFLMGADMFAILPQWREPERVCELALPVAVCRPGCQAVDFDLLQSVASPDRIAEMRRHRVEMPEIGLSATDLRRRIAAGESIRYRTPRAVEEYIASHGLYR